MKPAPGANLQMETFCCKIFDETEFATSCGVEIIWGLLKIESGYLTITATKHWPWLTPTAVAAIGAMNWKQSDLLWKGLEVN